MKRVGTGTLAWILTVVLLCLPTAGLRAGAPGAEEMEAAIKSGDFPGYMARATAWQETAPVELTLAKGRQTIRIQTPTTEHKRGIALRSFELRPL